MDRAAVFVDGEYLRKVVQFEFNNIPLNYEKLGPELCQRVHTDLDLLRLYWYDAMPYRSPVNPTAQEVRLREIKGRFIAKLKGIDCFEVRLGDCIKVYDQQGNETFIQKGIDTQLAIDLTLLSATNRISHAILLAGDGDFRPPVRAAKNQGIQVILFHGQTVARRLFDVADRRQGITQELIDAIRE